MEKQYLVLLFLAKKPETTETNPSYQTFKFLFFLFNFFTFFFFFFSNFVCWFFLFVLYCWSCPFFHSVCCSFYFILFFCFFFLSSSDVLQSKNEITAQDIDNKFLNRRTYADFLYVLFRHNCHNSLFPTEKDQNYIMKSPVSTLFIYGKERTWGMCRV